MLLKRIILYPALAGFFMPASFSTRCLFYIMHTVGALNMIELHQVSKQYRSGNQHCTALNSVSLKVKPGEIVGVIGKSGAGKSTLLRSINLLERPDSGDVIVNHQSLLSLSADELRQARRKIGMIFQHFNLLSSRTAAQNVALPLALHRQREQQHNIDDLLELVEMSDRAQYYPSQLSGGQKQRIAIARALITQPNVLLCDEITSALDPETTPSILRLLRRITTELNLSVLFITHDMEVIKSVADKVIVMDKGTIIEESNIINLFKNPQTQITKALTESSLHCELPRELSAKLTASQGDNSNAMIRIKFLGQPAVEPIIDTLIREKNLSINIFQANLEYIQNETIGMMILSATGQQQDIQAGIHYLKDKQCQTELLGYIHELKP